MPYTPTQLLNVNVFSMKLELWAKRDPRTGNSLLLWYPKTGNESFHKTSSKKNSFSLTAFIIYSPLYFLPPLFSSFVKKSILLFFVIWAPLLYEPFFCQSVSQLHLCVSVWTMSLITLFFFWRHGLSKQCKKYKSIICTTPCPQSPLNFPI